MMWANLSYNTNVDASTLSPFDPSSPADSQSCSAMGASGVGRSILTTVVALVRER